MTARPPFVKVPPGWVEQFGVRDAYVLAHIDFRCQHGGPGDFEHDGQGRRYWCASYETIAGEVCLKRDAVKRALLALKAQGVLLANRFHPGKDQTWGYHPDLPSGENALAQNGAEQPTGESALWEGENARGVGRKRPGTGAKTPDAPYIETVETKRESAGAPDVRDDSTPSTAAANDDPPPRFCPEHPRGTREKCGACQQHREKRRIWDREHEARLRAEAKALMAACQWCDEGGWVLDADGTPAEPAEKCAHLGVRIATVGGTDARSHP
ncbi:hypothetical protein [Mycolicibacterium hippocampi]|uniref:Uncharacterized protein n=1 Tax=Mycolicibacterium hippocampi TaxID=659824 RepID=A0A7I9ZRW8_9MYCO|nr:hypothetical protein [Mycolicibacterium hippocampi]GFH03388.1 hypothetical protein MHIP_38710 [Mycolicibacterium hippocampi]